MTAIATRLNFRVRPETEQRLRSAAAASNQSLTDFVISAAEERADEVLASHTLVPAEYFDALLEALDQPPQPNEALSKAVGQRRRFKRP
jgi:uncharacterized protein (DUF1778 family)